MRSLLMKDYTRILGQSQGYDALVVKDETVHCSVNGEGTPCMTTHWEPSLKDLQNLIEGGQVIITILGSDHPPIKVTVSDPFTDVLP